MRRIRTEWTGRPAGFGSPGQRVRGQPYVLELRVCVQVLFLSLVSSFQMADWGGLVTGLN